MKAILFHQPYPPHLETQPISIEKTITLRAFELAARRVSTCAQIIIVFALDVPARSIVRNGYGRVVVDIKIAAFQTGILLDHRASGVITNLHVVVREDVADDARRVVLA